MTFVTEILANMCVKFSFALLATSGTLSGHMRRSSQGVQTKSLLSQMQVSTQESSFKALWYIKVTVLSYNAL